GLRWQSMHHSICNDFSCHMSGMRSTCPWQVVQPMPLCRWMLWLKYTKSGRSCTRVHWIDRSVLKLSRTGSRKGLFEKICEWHVMQVLVGGIPAKADSSTEV